MNERMLNLIKRFDELGLPEGLSHIRAEDELKKNEAWLASYYFVYPLNKQLNFYMNDYVNLIKENRIRSHTVELLVKNGATPEQIATFAFEIAQEAMQLVLCRLADSGELEKDDYPSWKLVEVSKENKDSERQLEELYNLIPY